MPRRYRIVAIALVLIALVALGASSRAQQPGTPAPQAEAKPKPAEKQKTPEELAAEQADRELGQAVQQAGSERVALIRNLEQFLEKHPASPRRLDIFRALIEASTQVKDRERALRYAGLYLEAQPADLGMLLFAINQLEEKGDPAALDRALGYADRVVERVSQLGAGARPPQVNAADWEAEQKRLLTSAYLLRGRLFYQRKQYDRAQQDFAQSFEVLRTPQAAQQLGELAENRGDLDKAIEYYLVAFAAPEDYGAPVDHELLRRKMGNAWRLKHGSEAGLGEAVLATYDRLLHEAQTRKSTEPQATRNAGRTNLYDFELRKLDGSTLRLGQFAGKVLVLHFWATWCGACNVLEPYLEQVVDRFRADPDVVFLAANTEDDVEMIRTFIERERWKTPVVFEDGLMAFYQLEGLPVLLVLDRRGKVAYRGQGFVPSEIVPTLTKKIEEARAGEAP